MSVTYYVALCLFQPKKELRPVRRKSARTKIQPSGTQKPTRI